jgi:hypothetical protein
MRTKKMTIMKKRRKRNRKKVKRRMMETRIKTCPVIKKKLNYTRTLM